MTSSSSVLSSSLGSTERSSHRVTEPLSLQSSVSVVVGAGAGTWLRHRRHDPPVRATHHTQPSAASHWSELANTGF